MNREEQLKQSNDKLADMLILLVNLLKTTFKFLERISREQKGNISLHLDVIGFLAESNKELDKIIAMMKN